LTIDPQYQVSVSLVDSQSWF